MKTNLPEWNSMAPNIISAFFSLANPNERLDYLIKMRIFHSHGTGKFRPQAIKHSGKKFKS
jgi:hypothetical protein